MQIIEKCTDKYYLAYNVALKGVFSKFSVGLRFGVLTTSKAYEN